MLKTVSRILKDQIANNSTDNFKETSRIAMAKKLNAFNAYFQYCIDFHSFLVDTEQIEELERMFCELDTGVE